MEESIIKNKQYPKKYRECLLDYYKTDVELENEKNKEDIDKDRLKIIFYQKKIAFLDKYLDKLDIYKNLDINKNIHNSEDFDNTLKKMDLEIELLYYDYSIYYKLMKIRDLYNSYPINENEINRQRQYLFTKRKYYLELNKKLNENYMFQELRNDNSLDLQQKKYELAKIKQQQRNLSTKRKKLANLTQNKVKNSPKSFVEKYNLKRSHSQPNLSFLEREKLKKYEKAIQIIKFNNSI